ncbi:phosphotransferase family protein [Nocardioides plantarum]|uniref:Phosphotransferase family protein n=1 Tax=Nocardioides plantarum TaxID=29299 RepID=A0ABV5KD29_9ACTN|nr:phosphotransferase [Nocardioides plantarum]
MPVTRRHLAALLDVSGERVLVDAQGHLPTLDDEWPAHPALVAAVGDPGAVLAAPPVREPDGTVLDVLAWSGGPTGDGTRWLPVAEVEAPATLAARVAELRTGVVPDDGREPWFVAGWIDEVDAWVERALEGLGRVRSGPRELVKVWSLSAVVRYPVGDGTDVWFKATGAAFRAEPTLTAAIATIDPVTVPGVLALDASRAWMLLEAFPESEDDPTAQQVADVAAAHARLQLASLAHLPALVAAGAPDRGLAPTVAGLRRVVADGVERPTMTDEQRRAAADAEPWWADRVAELHGLGLPLTLVHGDLHLGNVTWRDAVPLLFDWTDACLAHPFLDARHLASSVGHHLGETVAVVVRGAYLDVWRQAYPDVDLDRAWDLAEVGDRVFTLVSYEGIYRAQPAWARWELAGISVELLDRLVSLRPA